MKEWSKSAYQTVSKPFVKAAVNLHITSNQITIFNHVMTLTVGCYAFSRGSYKWGLVGLLVCLINGFLDYLDGDVARETGTCNSLGVWLDSGFDVVIQNAVMASIAIGCFRMGMPLFVVLLFMISNSANNFVSFNYNAKFGFDSEKGNELFRSFMDQKGTDINVFLKNVIDPTSSYPALVLFTFRYWIAAGTLLGLMPLMFCILTCLNCIKFFVMYMLYAMHLRGDGNLHVLKALAILDEERNEFYALRYSQKV